MTTPFRPEEWEDSPPPSDAQLFGPEWQDSPPPSDTDVYGPEWQDSGPPPLQGEAEDTRPWYRKAWDLSRSIQTVPLRAAGELLSMAAEPVLAMTPEPLARRAEQDLRKFREVTTGEPEPLGLGSRFTRGLTQAGAGLLRAGQVVPELPFILPSPGLGGIPMGGPFGVAPSIPQAELEGVRELMAPLGRAAQAVAETGENVQVPEPASLEGKNFVERLVWAPVRTTAGAVAENAPNLSATMAAVYFGGPAAGAMVGGSLEAGSAYQDAVDSGADANTASRHAVIVGTVNSLMEGYSAWNILENALGKIPARNILYRFISSGLPEFTTEAAQETTNMVSEYFNGLKQAPKSFVEGLLRAFESGWSGLFTGGPIGMMGGGHAGGAETQAPTGQKTQRIYTDEDFADEAPIQGQEVDEATEEVFRRSAQQAALVTGERAMGPYREEEVTLPAALDEAQRRNSAAILRDAIASEEDPEVRAQYEKQLAAMETPAPRRGEAAETPPETGEVAPTEPYQATLKTAHGLQPVTNAAGTERGVLVPPDSPARQQLISERPWFYRVVTNPEEMAALERGEAPTMPQTDHGVNDRAAWGTLSQREAAELANQKAKVYGKALVVKMPTAALPASVLEIGNGKREWVGVRGGAAWANPEPLMVVDKTGVRNYIAPQGGAQGGNQQAGAGGVRAALPGAGAQPAQGNLPAGGRVLPVGTPAPVTGNAPGPEVPDAGRPPGVGATTPEPTTRPPETGAVSSTAQSTINDLATQILPGGMLPRGMEAYRDQLESLSIKDLESVLSWAYSSTPWIKRFLGAEIAAILRSRGVPVDTIEYQRGIRAPGGVTSDGQAILDALPEIKGKADFVAAAVKAGVPKDVAEASGALLDAFVTTWFKKKSVSNWTLSKAQIYQKILAGVIKGHKAYQKQAQQEGRVIRGAYSPLDDGRALIQIFRNADPSTLPHELGHVFRQNLRKVDARLADHANRWVGAETDQWTRAQEEQFARAFERWLRDGKAPTPTLSRVFEQFRTWLREVYKGIKGTQIDVQLTPEIKTVFKAMLGGPVIWKEGIELSEQDRADLEGVRQEIAEGEPGGRVAIEQDRQGSTKQWIGYSSTFPSWFQNKGYASQEAIHAIERAIAGKPLTERHADMVYDLLRGYQAEQEAQYGPRELYQEERKGGEAPWGYEEGLFGPVPKKAPQGPEKGAKSKVSGGQLFEGATSDLFGEPEERIKPTLHLEDDANFAREVDEVFSRKLTSGQSLHLGQTPEALTLAGAKPLPLVMREWVIKKKTKAEQLTPEQYKQLPAQLRDPIMVFESESAPNALVVLTELEKDGKPVVVAVHLERRETRHEVNRIASVYGKRSAVTLVNWAEQGRLRYANKQKSLAWLQSTGLRLRRGGSPAWLEGNIKTEADLVKPAGPGTLFQEGARKLELAPPGTPPGAPAEVHAMMKATGLDFQGLRQLAREGRAGFVQAAIKANLPSGTAFRAHAYIEDWNRRAAGWHAEQARQRKIAKAQKEREQAPEKWNKPEGKILKAFRVPGQGGQEAADLVKDLGKTAETLVQKVLKAHSNRLVYAAQWTDKLVLSQLRMSRAETKWFKENFVWAYEDQAKIPENMPNVKAFAEGWAKANEAAARQAELLHVRVTDPSYVYPDDPGRQSALETLLPMVRSTPVADASGTMMMAVTLDAKPGNAHQVRERIGNYLKDYGVSRAQLLQDLNGFDFKKRTTKGREFTRRNPLTYIPHQFTDEIRQALKDQKGSVFEAVKKEALAAGIDPSILIRLAQGDPLTTRRYGSLEYARLANLPRTITVDGKVVKVLQDDPAMLIKHLYKMARRLAIIEQFGQDSSDYAEALAREISQTAGGAIDQDVFKNLVVSMWTQLQGSGPLDHPLKNWPKLKTVLDILQSTAGTAHLSGAVIPNLLGGHLPGTIRMGLVPTLKGFVHAWATPIAKEEAELRMLGGLLQDLSMQMMLYEDVGEQWRDISRKALKGTGFTLVNFKINQAVAWSMAHQNLKAMLDAIKRDDQSFLARHWGWSKASAMRYLVNELHFTEADVKRMVENGPHPEDMARAISMEKEIENAMNESPATRPPAVNRYFFKLILAYSTYVRKFAKTTAYAINEAKHGNVAPLTRLMVAGQITGALIRAVRDWLKDRDREDESWPEALFMNFMEAGTFGLWGTVLDMFRGPVKSVRGRSKEIFSPPQLEFWTSGMDSLVATIKSVQKKAQGEDVEVLRPFIENMIRTVPAAGIVHAQVQKYGLAGKSAQKKSIAARLSRMVYATRGKNSKGEPHDYLDAKPGHEHTAERLLKRWREMEDTTDRELLDMISQYRER